MDVCKLISLGGLAGIVGLTGLSGCTLRQEPTSDDLTASVSMALSGVDYLGNSVRIIANRSGTVDAKYGACKRDITTGNCFNFDSTGHPAGADAVFTNLCPSGDVGDGDGTWRFTYQIFSSTDCHGTQLNNGAHNFTCYDINSLGDKSHPNQSVEDLDPGLNTNTIACITQPASKTFDFGTCWDVTAPGIFDSSTYDCGCVPTGPADCDCTGQFDGLTFAPPGCHFDPNIPDNTCNIVCP